MTEDTSTLVGGQRWNYHCSYCIGRSISCFGFRKSYLIMSECMYLGYDIAIEINVGISAYLFVQFDMMTSFNEGLSFGNDLFQKDFAIFFNFSLIQNVNYRQFTYTLEIILKRLSLRYLVVLRRFARLSFYEYERHPWLNCFQLIKTNI